MRASGRTSRSAVISMLCIGLAVTSVSASSRAGAVIDPHIVLVPADVGGAATASGSAVRLDAPPRTFSIVASGDVLNESMVNSIAAAAAGPGQRYDFSTMFAPVAPVLRSADLAICHMELPIGSPGASPGTVGRSPFGGNLILAPNEMAGAMKTAGFDRCSTASNHSNDLGPPGIDSTLDALDAAGLSHVGTARTPEESAVSTIVVNGVTVAHLSYTRFSNSYRPDAFRLNFAANVQEVVDDVATARGLGAEVIVLSVHIAKELLAAPTGVDREFLTDVTAATHIDLVVEHGPHVVQPVELVNGTWVYWSVGNFVSAMGETAGRYGDQRTLDGLLAWARFTETSPGTFTVEPVPVLICNQRATRTVYPVLSTLADEAIAADLRRQLEGCVARTGPVVVGLQ